MSHQPWYKIKNIAIYQVFISTFYIACGLHSITAIWLTYEITRSPFLVSVMIVASYLPSVIAGFTLSHWFSKGNPYKKLKIGVLILSSTMLLIVVTLVFSNDSHSITLIVIGFAQIVLSLVKLSNQSSLAVLIRSIFSKQKGKQVMEMASSNLLVSLSLGAGLAGLLLSIGFTYIGPAIAAILFAFSWVGVTKLEHRVNQYSLHTTSSNDDRPSYSKKISIFSEHDLQSLILFSICSSGTLQYINAVMAPLANHVLTNEPSYFSLLDVLSMLGGFSAGAALSSGRLKSNIALDNSLLAISAATILLAIANNPVLVAILVFILAFITTAHVISMQVKTNQIPRTELVSQYTVLRNASVSIAKICFSLLAGIVTTIMNIQTSWFVLAAIALCFGILWRIFPPQWRDKASDLQEPLQK